MAVNSYSLLDNRSWLKRQISKITLIKITAFALILAVSVTFALSSLQHGRRHPLRGSIGSAVNQNGLSPKLHFLFMATTDVPHAKEWSRFFSGAPAGSWTARLHCKNSTVCLNGDFVSSIPEVRVVPSVPTVYCTDLVSAEVQLLRDALQGDASGPEREADKFILLSDSTLPLKSYAEVFAALTDHTESDFCIYPTSEWFLWKDLSDNKRAYVPTHSQFAQLNHQDAWTFVRGWEAAGNGEPWKDMSFIGGDSYSEDSPRNVSASVPVWKVQISDGAQASKVNVSIEEFDGWEFCADENVKFSLIFGAIVFDSREHRRDIDGFGTLWHDDKHKYLVQGRCFTYFSFNMWSIDDWAVESKLAKVGNSTVHKTTPNNPSHPLEMGDLSSEAVKILHDTPYLFGRKFQPDSYLHAYEDIVLTPPKAVEVPKPVLHFMFLAIDSVGHAPIWQKFFASAPRNTWRAWLHCTEPSACRNSDIYRSIPGIHIVETKPTIYCNDLLTAPVQLMKEALYSTAALPGTMEKFILVGDTTLPVKPFSEIYRILTEHDTSDFCMYPTSEWMEKQINGSILYAPQHHQWIVLNRPDAYTLYNQWDPTWDEDEWPDWDVALHGASRDIAGTGHLLASNFSDGDPWWACTDELAPFNILYGAFVPGADGTQHYPGLGTLRIDRPLNQGRCRTLVLWNETSTQDEVKHALVDDPCTDVILPTWMSNGSDPACFGEFSKEALWRLRASDYLFIRKVLPNATLQDYADIAFVDHDKLPLGSGKLHALRKECESGLT